MRRAEAVVKHMLHTMGRHVRDYAQASATGTPLRTTHIKSLGFVQLQQKPMGCEKTAHRGIRYMSHGGWPTVGIRIEAKKPGKKLRPVTVLAITESTIALARHRRSVRRGHKS